MATKSNIVNEEAPPEADDNGLLRSSTSTFQSYQPRGDTSMVSPDNDGVDMGEEKLTNEGLPLASKASVLSTEMSPNCPPNDEEQTVFTLLNITNQFNQRRKIISQRASKYDLNSTNMFRNLMLFHRERFKQGDRSRVPLSADKDIYDYLSYYDSKKLTKICRYADAISEWPKRPSYGQRDILNNRSDNEINNDRNNIESSKSDCEMVLSDASQGDSQQQLQFDGEHEYSGSNENNDFFASQINEPDNNYQGLDYGGDFDFDNQEQFYDQNVEGFYDDDYNLDSSLGWLNSGAETDLNDGIEGFDSEEQNAFATFEENLNNLQDDDDEFNNENLRELVSSNSLIYFANQSQDPDDLATSSMQLINNESNVMWQQQELPSGSLQQSLLDVEPNNSDYEMLQINALQQQQQFDDEHEYSDSSENDFLASQINHSIDNNYQGLDYGDQFVFDNQQNMEGIMMVNNNDGSEGNEEQSAVDGEQENSVNNEANNSLASQITQSNNNFERFDNGGDQFALDDQQQFNNQNIELVCPDFRNHYEGYNSDSSIECLVSEKKIDSNDNIKVSDTNEEQSANQTNDTNVVQVVTNLIEPVNDEPIMMGQQQELPSKSTRTKIQANDDNLNNCDSDGDETEIDESWKEYENHSSAQESFFVIDNARNGTNNSCEPSDDTSLNGSIAIPSTSVHQLRRSSRTTTKSRTDLEKNNSESGSDSAIALPKSKESTAKKRKQPLQSNKAKKKARKDAEEDDRELGDEFEDEQGGMNRREVRKNECRKIVKTIGFYCPECSEFVVNKHKLNEHLLSVHKISPFICHVFGCKQRFDKSKLLKEHYQLHEDKTKLTCTAANCKYTTSKRNCLMAHFSLYHMEGRFGCRLCLKEYPFKRQLYNHFFRDHKTETYRRCTFGECSFQSARECELKEHQICHTNLKPFECTWKDCGFVANRHRNVTTHVRAVHFKLPVTLKAMKKRKIKCDRDPKQYVRTKSFDLDAELKKELEKAQRNYNSKDKGGNGHSIASTSGVEQRSL